MLKTILIKPKKKSAAKSVKERLRHRKKKLVKSATVPTPKIEKESE